VHACRATSSFAFALCLTASTTAFADDKSRADEQFEFGLGEMQAGRYDIGCPALAESYHLDPAMGALFTLAACEAKWGRVASSVTHYQQYLELFELLSAEGREKQKGREKTAASQLELLEPRVPKLIITLSERTPPGATVKLDGSLLDPVALGTPTPVDPGDHVVTAQVEDGAVEQHRITVHESENARLYLDLSAGGSKVADVPATPPPGHTEPNRSSSGPPTGAYVAGGVGIAGIAVGAITGFVALGEKSTIDEHCPDRQCDAEGHDAVDSGQSMALISTIGFGVGVVGLATGVVLLLTASSDGQAEVGTQNRFTVGSKHLPGGEMLTMETSW